MLINGFNIPSYHDSDTDTQLIAESFIDLVEEASVFECLYCDHIINLNDKEVFDYGRLLAIKSFHHNIFSNFNNS